MAAFRDIREMDVRASGRDNVIDLRRRRWASLRRHNGVLRYWARFAMTCPCEAGALPAVAFGADTVPPWRAVRPAAWPFAIAPGLLAVAAAACRWAFSLVAAVFAAARFLAAAVRLADAATALSCLA